MLYFKCIAINTATNKPVLEPEYMSFTPPSSSVTNFTAASIMCAKYVAHLLVQKETNPIVRGALLGVDWRVQCVRVSEAECGAMA